MTWEICEIEASAEKILRGKFGESKGTELFGIYSNARNILLENVLPEIHARRPHLTDHGPNHISNVLNNAHKLLGNAITKLTASELYCLLMSILFHDVGNFYEREEHQNKITEVYDFVRRGAREIYQEKFIVLKLVGAHCGRLPNGSRDTIQQIYLTTHLEGEKVDLALLASIVRLADELAEGVQRTSLFMHHIHGYPLESNLHHTYAKITQVDIDRGNERIALTYHIPIGSKAGSALTTAEKDHLSELIDFTYRRIIKLDQERQYAKYYCPYFSPFKKTTVTFNFWIKGVPQDFGLNQLILSDLVIPGDIQKEIQDYDPSYERDAIIDAISTALEEMSD